MAAPRVAVAIPAFNEADGLGGFLVEIDRALAPLVDELRIVVVDDASTDGTPAVASAVAPQLGCALAMITNQRNQGHGPSLMSAYRRALEARPDFVLQVDGDGQFHGSDLRRVLVLLMDQAHAVCGVRRFRQDPWFRMRMTGVLRSYLRTAFGVRARDANCPLRGYDATVLEWLLRAIPDQTLVPNLYLTILAARSGFPLLEVDVSHRVRRGPASLGSTWGRGISPVQWRLLRFSVQAFRESLAFRALLRELPRRDPVLAGMPGPQAHETPRSSGR